MFAVQSQTYATAFRLAIPAARCACSVRERMISEGAPNQGVIVNPVPDDKDDFLFGTLQGHAN